MEIKRSSVASLKRLTGVLSRGFGYKIWNQDTEVEWLRELESGEKRLRYDENGEND